MKKDQKTAVQKLRERFYRVKNSIKPSSEMYEILKKEIKPEPSKNGQTRERNIARPRSTHPEKEV